MRLFEESILAGMTLKNRTISSATHEGMGDPDGYSLEAPVIACYIRQLS